MLSVGLSMMVVMSFVSCKLVKYLARYLEIKIDVHMKFLFDSLSIACFHENGAWICHVYGLMVLLVYSLIISGNVCS